MSDNLPHETFMREAIEESKKGKAAGNFPYGSVIVQGGKIIARGRNLRTTSFDPTAHAETNAIRTAVNVLQRGNFSNCTLYTTSEPCPMCFAGVLLSGIRTLVIGARRNPHDMAWGVYSPEKFLAAPFCSNPITIIRDVLAEECASVRDDVGNQK
jgi:tRNA(adenine34) deaminase